MVISLAILRYILLRKLRKTLRTNGTENSFTSVKPSFSSLDFDTVNLVVFKEKNLCNNFWEKIHETIIATFFTATYKHQLLGEWCGYDGQPRYRYFDDDGSSIFGLFYNKSNPNHLFL